MVTVLSGSCIRNVTVRSDFGFFDRNIYTFFRVIGLMIGVYAELKPCSTTVGITRSWGHSGAILRSQLMIETMQVMNINQFVMQYMRLILCRLHAELNLTTYPELSQHP